MSQEEENTTTPMMEYAAQKYAPVSTETTTETEIVPETTSEETTAAPVSTEIVETTTTLETTDATPPSSTETPVVVDYSEFLAKESEGLFTDVDSFKAALPKIKQYDTKVTEYEALLATKTELEEKVKTMITPANDYAKTLNEMLLAGKTADEIENFTKISRLDLDQISAIDAKVMVMVKNGYSESIARDIVESEFPIEDYEVDSKERLILEEKLRVSSLEDRNILKAYKKDLTTIDNSAQVQAQEQAEQLRLQGIAKAEEHKTTVKQQVPKIAETIMGLGEKVLNGKEGDEAVKLNFDYNAEYKAEIPAKVESFFLDAQMEVTPENIALVERYIKADYLERNFDQIAQSIFKHAEAITTEKMVNKYENRTGLPPESTNVVVDTSKQEYNDFLNRIAKSR